MTRYGRIGAIYRKELINILRDRRTMVAMVLIPVVLYPLLMLGFVRTMEGEADRLRAQQFVVETDDEAMAAALREIVALTKDPADEKRATFDVRAGETPRPALGYDVQLHVSLSVQATPEPFPPQLRVELAYSEVDVRSRAAMDALADLLERYGQLQTRTSLGKLLQGRSIGDAPAGADVEMVLSPVVLKTVSAATEEQRGGWALGMIVPSILVLMTITGAVYPAIDLTAGERERGTLEALLATPVPILHLIVAKFLVVATVGLLAAVINVLSVGATMHFGGLTRSIAEHLPVEFPATAIPIILLCMIPFALLSAAILVAACSFARSFKEAQNYVMPIILIALVPTFAAAVPSVRLEGVLLVVPVGNMVLLTRELFQQTCSWPQIGVVLLSTTLYAAAAVGIAARLFGTEAVLFADAGSYRTMLQRRLFRPAKTPTASQALLLAAVLFPAAFFANSLLAESFAKDFVATVGRLAIVQFFGLFVLVPVLLTVYLKIDVATTFRLRPPPARAWAAALLIGSSTWIVARELFALQVRVLEPSDALQAFSQQVSPQLAAAPIGMVLLLLAIVPAVSEEMLFRGFLLSGVGRASRKWPAIIAVAVIFGVFHFMIDRVPVTVLMGVVLGYLCWQCRSIWPGMIAHAMHNGLSVVIDRLPTVAEWIGMSGTDADMSAHVPARALIPALALLAAGLAVAASIRQPASWQASPTPSPLVSS